jgi:chorismate-pyruvate lyase
MLSLAPPGMAQSGERLWNNSPVSRLAALALLEELNSELLSHESATLVLEEWCGKHHIAAPAHIVAERGKNANKQPTQEQLHRLGVKDAELVRYRAVKLRCGDQILSEADNWYVPSRLSAGMNKALETTDISFGRAVAPLHFHRHTLSAELLWSPLPQGWEAAAKIETGNDNALRIPAHVLQHHAVLTRADGLPFSEVVETYTDKVLDFDLPLAR